MGLGFFGLLMSLDRLELRFAFPFPAARVKLPRLATSALATARLPES
jgi:hypothetical protein